MKLNPKQITLEEFFHRTIKELSEPHSLLLIMPASLGDLLANGRLAHALKKKYNKDIILVVRDRFIDFKIKFDGISKIKYITTNVMNILGQYIVTTGNYSNKEIYLYGHFHADARIRLDYYLFDKELNFFDRYKKNVFDLPLDTEMSNPIIGEISSQDKLKLNKSYLLDKSRTVIIAPQANTVKLMNKDFWIKIVNVLHSKGYTVYENVGKNMNNLGEISLFGDLAMPVDLNELFYIANKINCFIGVRSGVFDLLSSSEARLFDISQPNFWDCEIGLLYPESNSRTFYSALPALQDFKNLMEQHNIASLNLSNLIFNNVRNDDVYFSEEALLEALLEAVLKNKVTRAFQL